MKSSFIFKILAIFLFVVISSLFISGRYENLPKRQVKGDILAINEAGSAGRVSLIFAGDMMFDRYIRTVGEKNGQDYIFSCISDYLQSADLVIGNLEGPITNKPSVSVGSISGGENNFTFTFSPPTALLLKRHNIKLVNIGNNHSMDFGIEGVKQTTDNLMRSGVAFFGEYGRQNTLRTEINGVRFEFISYNQFGGDVDTTKRQIELAREGGFIPIVYTHWGSEYEKIQPSLYGLATDFIERGAEAVIGSHPHVIGEVEIYEGKPIFYSLGNFIFDQYFDDDVRKGLIVRMEFDERGLTSWQEIEVSMELDGRTCLKM
jgi:poly-gamma-glutamate capsule biosynthesis protein CapA/YwtB (metallophosphatase superfamily)